MRISFILFFITGIFFQVQAQDSTHVNDEETSFTMIQIQPEFPGGDAAFYEFIKSNLVYPKDAKRKKIQGVVYVQFMVEKDGSLSNISIVPNRSLSPSCDQAAIDVITKSPKWNPGSINYKPHKAKKTVAVKFSLPS